MGQSFLASEGTIIGTQDASGNWVWAEDLSTLSVDEIRTVENFRRRTQQQKEGRPIHPEDHCLPAQAAAG
jgi:hypothetical protein